MSGYFSPKIAKMWAKIIIFINNIAIIWQLIGKIIFQFAKIERKTINIIYSNLRRLREKL